MLDANQLTSLSVPIATAVQLIFYVVVGAYVIFSAILYYHWQNYASNSKVSGYTLVSYAALTLPLVVVMGILVLVI